jgi:hypothetical protein
VTVRRARKIQQFLSQPFFVAEQFTGMPGRFVPLKETVRSFKEIIEGKHDSLPEQAFKYQGSIDDVIAAARVGKEAEDEASTESAAAAEAAATASATAEAPAETAVKAKRRRGKA